MAVTPWDQREDESNPAYKAFLTYRDLGIDRTINGAYLKDQQARGRHTEAVKGEILASGTWRVWSKTFAWVARCKAWDAHIEGTVDAARQQQLAAIGKALADEQWESGLAKRRKEQEQAEWSMRQRLMEVASKMLDHALFSKTDVGMGDEKVIVLQPAGWSMYTPARFIELATKIGRLSAKMPHHIDDDVTVDTDTEAAMFDTSGQLADRVPDGVMPPIPDELNVPPPRSESMSRTLDNPHGLILPDEVPRPDPTTQPRRRRPPPGPPKMGGQ